MNERVHIQRKRVMTPASTPVLNDVLQGIPTAPPQAVNAMPSIVQGVLTSPGQSLGEGTRTFMELRFGHDFSQVRVHTDEQAVESAQAVKALAYTVGQDVVFGEGQYAPETLAGKKLLAHELTHVVQQAQMPTSDIRRAESDTAAQPVSQPAAAEDADIEALDLTSTAKAAAKKLKEKHPDIVFKSGRRTIAEQAHAMATNIVQSNNRKWIEQTYKSAAELQKWVDDNPKATTVDDIAKGLETVMNGMAESDRAKVSKHLSGEAFDVQPQDKNTEAIKKDIQALPGLTKFLDKEGGLVRWHAQFKKAEEVRHSDDKYEQEAEQVADQIVNVASSESRKSSETRSRTLQAVDSFTDFNEVPSLVQMGNISVSQFNPVAINLTATPSIQRQPASASPTIKVGIIPIEEFIRHVEVIERSFPDKSPQEILTMIRTLYYGSPAGSPAFDRLIPDAPSTGAVENCADSEGALCTEAVGDCICIYAEGLAMDTPQLQAAVRRLRQHANENAIADNPSPYIQVGNDVIDVGHVLVGVDALLHSQTASPFSNQGLTSAPGPATWVGDLGAAMVYLKEHEVNHHKSNDVVGNPSPTLEDYYHNSLPMSDLLGDVDAYGMASMVVQQTLSGALRSYYLSEAGGGPRFRYNRWQNFALMNDLTYTQIENTITWAADAKRNVEQRIKVFADLFAQRSGGYWSSFSTFIVHVDIQEWDQAGAFSDRFLLDVKHGLEAELANQQGR